MIDNKISNGDILKCPKCNSTQLTADKRGFNSGKAVAGAVLTGGVGLLAGLHGKDRLVVYCMSCGSKWKPEDYDKEKEKYKVNKVIDDGLKFGSKFQSLYKSDKIEAQKFAEENNLFTDEYNSIESLYKKYRNNSMGGTIVMVVFALIVFFILYQCNKGDV